VVRSAEASWQGTVSAGAGEIALGSQAFSGPYSLKGRVEEGVHATNPEELLGAAEAGCFTMSLANLLEEAGHEVRDLRTHAKVTLGEADGSFNITSIALHTVGDVPGLDPARFHELAQEAKDCTVSRVLTGTQITLDAHLSEGR
jgi:osmotically inducible protein OsmC